MKAVDTHAHLDFPQFNQDRFEVITKLGNKGISVINIATDQNSILKVVELSEKFDHLYAAVGIHPTDLNKNSLKELPTVLDQIRQMVKSSKKVVAIGEVGLDYFRDKSKQTAEIQLAALTLAQDLQKPVVFHCRDAYGDLLTLLKDYSGIKGVVHCFNGTLDQAQQFIAIGMKLSVTAIITYPANETLRQIVKQLSLEELMLETDCPFFFFL